jgi:hypothetical protein|tara:strand:+ start:37 stop:453 length:417 start_codon:yes stop_codon:yes gene_type:complete
MATNYLSASLLSDTYQNMLDADDRENAKQLARALSDAKSKGLSLDANNPLRNDNGFLISYSTKEGDSAENTYQTLRIRNSIKKTHSHLNHKVLQEKIRFSELKTSEKPPTQDELLTKAQILDARIKEYEDLIAGLSDG